MANNITEVRLLNVPLENDYLHTLYFSSREKQSSYFLSRAVKVYTDFNYQRKDNIIRVPAHYDSILNCNYVMYRNSAYSSKWFYSFITDMKYIDDGRTDISIETDVIQTWFFDYTVKQSFVEREHVKDDTIGLHTIEESLEFGDYVCGQHLIDPKPTLTKIVMGSTVTPSELDKDIGGQYGGIYSGVKYYTYSAENTTKALQSLADNTKEDAVSSLFIAPSFLIKNAPGGIIEDSDAAEEYTYSLSKNNSFLLEGYKPKNNKLYVYPFCYLLVTNANGASAIYKFEYFDSTEETYNFKVVGTLCPGTSIRMFPTNYKGILNNFDEGLNLGKFPQCNWATDMYINWLTQNGVNVATSLANSASSMLGGAVAGALLGPGGAVAGAAISGVSQIANTLHTVKMAEMMPPQTSGNVNCGDVISSSGNNSFHYYRMSIRKEFAEIIDKYFDMFGYKVNMLKVPEKNHRANYWYTKCIDVNIDGAIPMKDMRKIKDCYNRGITFWSNPANIGNYSVSNTINS